MATWLAGLWCGLVWARAFVSGDLDPALNEVLQAGLLGLGLLVWWPRRARASLPRPLAWPLALLLVVGAVGVVTAGASSRAVSTWLELFGGVSAVLVLPSLEVPERRRVLHGLCAAGVLIALFALLQYVAIFPQLAGGAWADRMEPIRDVVARRRAYGPFSLPNFFAGYLALLLPLVVGLAVRAAWHAPVRVVILGLLGTGLLLAQSLGATLALVASSGMAVLRRTRRWRVRATWFIVSLITVGGLLAARPMLRDVSHSQHPVYHRLAYWGVALEVLQEHPVWGAGLGRYRDAYQQRRPAGATGAIHAHNSYLELAADLGLAGLAVWLWLAVVVGRFAWRRSPWLGIAAGAFLFHNLVDATLYIGQVNVLWWVLAGLAATPDPHQ